MQFEIHAKDIPISEQLRVHIERRLSFALERFAMRIVKVCVSVGDLNGPRGGVDKRCQVAIVLMPSTTIVMEDRDSNIYVAINRVADKAGRCIGRRLKRRKSGGRQTRISELL
ncbi:MAG: ribosome-associated translation inhibitor RaiA [Acidobacteriia bacterium]|nr:ribosome-associated translation inhibitor RaiA [Terriglobia bacterium]